MGRSFSAILTYGIPYDEDSLDQLPWYAEEFDGEIKSWWQTINGYDNPDSYIVGADNTEHLKFEDEWNLKNPLPIDIKWFGYEGTSQIVTPKNVPYYKAYCEYLAFNPADLVAPVDYDFLEFVQSYIPNAPEPRWIIAPLIM